MNTILEQIIRWGVPFVCGGIVGAVTFGWKFFSAIRTGLQCLLRAEIIRSHEKYMERRYCPIYARESLRRAYKAYHVLGGNDVATSLYNDLMKLPTEGEHHG